jgi:hypothetical protein
MEIFNQTLAQLFAEGSYIDLWTLPHILFGVLMFLLIQRYKKDIWFGFFLTLVLAILWEFFEVFFEIFETIQNQIVDVGIALVGYLIMIASRLKPENNTNVLKVTLFFWGLTNFLGWLSYYLQSLG